MHNIWYGTKERIMRLKSVYRESMEAQDEKNKHVMGRCNTDYQYEHTDVC